MDSRRDSALAETLLDRGETDEAWSLALDSLGEEREDRGEPACVGRRVRVACRRASRRSAELEAAETSLRRGLTEARASGDSGVEAGLQRDLGLLPPTEVGWTRP